MTIRARLRLLIALPVLVAIVATVILGALVRRLDHAMGHNRRAADIATAAFELNILTHEYGVDPGERIRQQWHGLHNRLRDELGDVGLRHPWLLVPVRAAQRDHDRVGVLFADVESATAEPEAANAARQEFIRMRQAELFAKTHSLYSRTTQLMVAAEQARAAAYRRAILSLVILLTAAAAVLTIVAVLVSRSIVRPLARMRGAVHKVAAGDLTSQVGYRAADEVGELAAAFDQMTTRLQTITVSRDELARENAERRRAEQQLEEKSAELERSNRELEQFAYVASHDLQEPLRMVTSYVQLLQRRYEGQLDARAQEFMAFAVDGALRMQRLIRDLLLYSRVGRRRQPFAPVACETVCDLALENLAVAVRESGAVIERGPLPAVLGDETQLLQLFQNLLGNALKFRGTDPPRVVVRATRSGADWEIAVADNGIGIAPEHFDRLFQVFQRLHPRDKYPGTGIGLAICKRIVENHGGRITVTSVPGRGTTFTFSLPALPPPATGGPDGEPAPGNSRRHPGETHE